MNPVAFISYCREDKAVAEAVVAGLEANGIPCWIAPRNVRPGENWGGSIIKAITNAKVMVLVFSQHTNNSPHVMNEIERAVSRRVTIIPFRLQDVKPSEDLELFISSCHWLDALTPPLDAHVADLVRAVQGVLGIEFSGAADIPATTVPAAPVQTAPPKTSKTPLLLGAAVVIVLVAAAALYHFSRGSDATPPQENASPAVAAADNAEVEARPTAEAEAPEATPLDPLAAAKDLEDRQDFVGALAAYADLLAADPGNPDLRLRAENVISRLLEDGNVSDTDGRLGGSTRKLADANLAAAQNFLGIQLRKSNPEESLVFFKKAAAQGMPRAMAEVGLMLSNGDGAPMDLTEAAAWLKKSAEAGSTDGMLLYAECLLGGKGVPVNEAEAATLYTQAAALGNLGAKMHLARMYQKGIGMPAPDPKEAFRLYQEAADQGYVEAQGRLGAMYMSGEAGEADREKAVQLWQDGARKDDAVCMLFYAMALENGDAGPPNRDEASVWYQRAARKGNADAVRWCVDNKISF
ncbi:MAG: toll/interleukin-1 receptor domain-containing protein [Chthoniobacterales bacterium]|nr:toll/interleukin-1 receptor domain-containing protein [Chthoniobacterales bacterium]